MDELDFQTLSTDNCYVNPAGIHSCFPMKKKKSNESSDIDNDLITVNNFFCSLNKRNKCNKIWK